MVTATKAKPRPAIKSAMAKRDRSTGRFVPKVAARALVRSRALEPKAPATVARKAAPASKTVKAQVHGTTTRPKATGKSKGKQTNTGTWLLLGAAAVAVFVWRSKLRALISPTPTPAEIMASKITALNLETARFQAANMRAEQAQQQLALQAPQHPQGGAPITERGARPDVHIY